MRNCLLIWTCSIIATAAIVCAGFMMWLRSQTTYYVSAYRIDSLVDSKSNESVQRRLYPVDFESCTVAFEWNTYDNSDITKGPYKLFVVVTPKTPNLESVTLTSIQIDSSNKGTKYADFIDKPASRMLIEHSKERISGKVTRGIAFGYDSGEEISTTINIEFGFKDRVETEEIVLKWKPVRIRYWSSYL